MGYPATRPQIMAYFTEHPNKTVTLDAISKGTKLRADQVRSAVSNIRTAHSNHEIDFPIEIVQRGQIWRYSPNGQVADVAAAKSNKAIYEELGMTKAGDLIIQDESGKLYRAQEL